MNTDNEMNEYLTRLDDYSDKFEKAIELERSFMASMENVSE